MFSSDSRTTPLAHVAAALCALVLATTVACAQATRTCFPTCLETDARFLSLVGTSLHSLSGDEIILNFRVPETETVFNLEIFDGETGGLWDVVGSTIEFTVFADPDNSGTIDSGEVAYGPFMGSEMADNGWHTISVPTTNDARLSAAGTFFYTVRARLADASVPGTWSNFKIRANANILLQTQAFAFCAPMFTVNEARIVYPNFDPANMTSAASLANSTYDGTWRFYMQVEKGTKFGTRLDTAFVDIWDADMDVGSFDGTDLDTDDPNTPNAPFLPAWSGGTSAMAEGAVAVASPYDDNRNLLFRRSPAIRYVLKGPDGTIYANDNPSGSQEWERFSASLLGGVPTVHDHAATELPDGIYEAVITGMDLNNMNSWRSTFKFIGVCDSGGACAPPPARVDESPCDGVTSTKGYWKNHPDRWPVNTLYIGGAWRDRATLMEWLSSEATDKFNVLASQLVAALLIIADGAEDKCITDEVAAADAWIGLLLPNRPVAGGALWSSTARELAKKLDAYNNGLLCAPHRDAVAGCDDEGEIASSHGRKGKPGVR